MKRQNKGITLIALIITVIVLLILSAVTLNLVLGQNGIISKAQISRDKTNIANQEEEKKIKDLEEKLKDYENSTSRTEFIKDIQVDELLSFTQRTSGTINVNNLSEYKFIILYVMDGTKNVKASTILPIELFKSINTIEAMHYNGKSHWWAKAQYETDTSIYYDTTDGMTIYGIK